MIRLIYVCAVYCVLWVGLLLGYACTPKQDRPFALAPLFAENMVLQRNQPNTLWGTGAAGTTVQVLLQGQPYTTKVDHQGHWSVRTAPLPAGGPYTMQVQTHADTLRVAQVWVGDVWLCSGQSNMEFSVGNFAWSQDEVNKADNAQIFYYTLPNQVDLVPNGEVPAAQWKVATGSNILPLSATAYFFARHIQPEVGVPVGLLVADWSGTAIEPWMSSQALDTFPQFATALAELRANNKTAQEVRSDLEAYRKAGWDSLYYLAGQGMQQQWYMPGTDYSQWTPIKLPTYWEDAHIGLDNFDGAVWFQTTFDAPDHVVDSSFHIFLNYIKDYNRVWVNGHMIGETFGHNNWSDYYAPLRYLKAKDNLLVVRVFNVQGKGGITYHPFWETPILAGHWVCRAEQPIDSGTFPIPAIVNINPFSTPTGIYNAMIYPLLRYALRGVIWYQGESNAGRAQEYGQLFPAMIQDWRTQFGQDSLPFYFVQLANFDQECAQPCASDWAELRQSQERALQLPHTGMATAIDLGEAQNIHPANKQEVGRRLALLALADTYGQAVQAQAPRIDTVVFVGEQARVSVWSQSGLHLRQPKVAVRGFALAGADSVFYWADRVQVVHDKIVVQSTHVPQPVALRYAWGKNPGVLNLYDEGGLPLLPYRSDNWPGVTTGRVYHPDIIYF